MNSAALAAKTRHGFTLIETLVALLVVAVAYAGVVTALANFADQRLMIEQRNAAHRIAWNKLVSKYLDSKGFQRRQASSTRNDNDVVTVGPATWQWKIDHQPGSGDTLSRFQVDIFLMGEQQGRPVRSLVIFLP